MNSKSKDSQGFYVLIKTIKMLLFLDIKAILTGSQWSVPFIFLKKVDCNMKSFWDLKLPFVICMNCVQSSTLNKSDKMVQEGRTRCVFELLFKNQVTKTSYIFVWISCWFHDSYNRPDIFCIFKKQVHSIDWNDSKCSGMDEVKLAEDKL